MRYLTYTVGHSSKSRIATGWYLILNPRFREIHPVTRLFDSKILTPWKISLRSTQSQDIGKIIIFFQSKVVIVFSPRSQTF
jgi:hypothetical protein